MSNNRQPSRPRSERRRRERHMRRLGLEALESRACPAVMFDFEGGILGITGDEGPNVIEIFQSRDGVVEVTGDREQRTFEGVNLVSVETGDGDDTVGWTGGVRVAGGDVEHSVHIDVGDGNDTIRIGDGEPTAPGDGRLLFGNDSGVWTVDFGTGSDYLRVALNNHHHVSLDVLSEDGGDVIEAPISINVCQHPDGSSFACGLRASLQLGGGDNRVDIQALGFGNADLSVDASGGGNTIYIGSANGRVWKTTDGSSALISLELGGGDNDVKLGFKGIEEVNLQLHAMGGGNTVEIAGGPHEQTPQQLFFPGKLRLGAQFGGGSNVVDVSTKGFGQVDLDVVALGGSNTVQFAGDAEDYRDVYMVEPLPPWCEIDLDFGGGGNLVNVDTKDFDRAALHLKALGGNNVVKHELGHSLGFRHEHTRPETAAVADIMLSGDGNQVGFKALGYENVDLDLDLTGNSNTVEIGLLLPAVQKVRESAARIDLDVGGDSLVDVRLENIDNVDLSLVSDPASPEPVTGGTINVYWHVITNGSSRLGRNDGVVILHSSLPGGSAVPRTPGSPPTFSFAATAGADAPTSVNAALNLGPEDDTVSILSRNVDDLGLGLSTGDGDDTVKMNTNWSYRAGSIQNRPFVYHIDLGAGDDMLTANSAGYTDVTSLIDGGDGDDEIRIRHRMFAVVDRTQLNIVVLLGLGSDALVLETVGYHAIRTSVDTGPEEDGTDTISASHRSLSRSSHGRGVYRLFLDDGRDVFDGFAVGYAVQEPVGEGAVVEWVFGVELPRA